MRGTFHKWIEIKEYNLFLPKSLLLFAINFRLLDEGYAHVYFSKAELRYGFYQTTGYLLDVKQIEGALHYLTTNEFLFETDGFGAGYRKIYYPKDAVVFEDKIDERDGKIMTVRTHSPITDDRKREHIRLKIIEKLKLRLNSENQLSQKQLSRTSAATK